MATTVTIPMAPIAAIPRFSTRGTPTIYTTVTCTISMKIIMMNIPWASLARTPIPVRPIIHAATMPRGINMAPIAATRPCPTGTTRTTLSPVTCIIHTVSIATTTARSKPEVQTIDQGPVTERAAVPFQRLSVFSQRSTPSRTVVEKRQAGMRSIVRHHGSF